MPEKIEFDYLNTNDWDLILENLQGNSSNCILFLGPEALVSKNKNIENTNEYKPLINVLSENLIAKLETDKKPVNKSQVDALSPFALKEYFLSCYKKKATGIGLWNKMFKEIFIKENLNSTLIEKLPYIPFPIIINTSPDVLLYELFIESAKLKETQFSHFNYKDNSRQIKDENEQKKIISASLNNPIIYNLFGSINDPDSIVSTPEDLLEYVFSIISKGQVNDFIMESIKSSKHLIFLGFDFESWHLRLLLRFFDISKITREEKNTYVHPGNLEKKETFEYFQKLFEVTFVKNNIVQFVDELSNKCKVKRTFTKVDSDMSFEDNFKEELLNLLLKQNSFNEAAGKIEAYLKEKKKKDKLSSLLDCIEIHNRLVKQRNQKRITQDHFEVEITYARDGLKDFIENELFC